MKMLFLHDNGRLSTLQPLHHFARSGQTVHENSYILSIFLQRTFYFYRHLKTDKTYLFFHTAVDVIDVGLSYPL